MTTTTAQNASARYFGSITSHHGEVRLISDCGCTDCARLDLTDPARRFELYVFTDTGHELVKLEHVRSASFTGTRSGTF